jgi:hypothetical protein
MTKDLLALIRELQILEPLGHFALAGGSNLAIRFNHRKSVDIDLFTNRVIGIKGWQDIEEAIRQKFGGAVLFCNIVNKELGDQFCFLRALIIQGEEQIKIDMIQNIQHLDEVENIEGIKMLSVRDIGLFKLMAASSRFAKKDIYDLDLITDHFDLPYLLKVLKEKQIRYNEDRYRCLFDLDQERNPLDDISVLLFFDNAEFKSSDTRHTHSGDRLDILEEGKTWMGAKSSWKKKIKGLIENQ